MDGKIREGFIDWMVIDNVFNVPIDFTWDKETYKEKVRNASIISFYNANEGTREELYHRYDALKKVICV